MLAVESAGTSAIAASIATLRSRAGVAQVLLLGGADGADAILDLASSQPDIADGLILLSPSTVAEGLGEEPKLFVATEGQPEEDVATWMAATAPGADNEAVLAPGPPLTASGYGAPAPKPAAPQSSSVGGLELFTSEQAGPVYEAIYERMERWKAP